MKIMRVVKEREGYELGEVVLVGVVPSGNLVNPDYAQYSGMYWHMDENARDNYFTQDELEQVQVLLEEVMTYPITYTDSGVQNKEDFIAALGLNEWDFDWERSAEFNVRTNLEFFDRWYCTDTWVGVGILSIDGERVALFSQRSRRGDCNFKWLSKEAKLRAKAFAQEFLKTEEDIDDVLEEGENLVHFIY